MRKLLLSYIVASLLLIGGAALVVHASPITPISGGGLQTSTAPTNGYLLIGNSNNTYSFIASSSFGGKVGPSTSTYLCVFNTSSTCTGYVQLTYDPVTRLFTIPTTTASGPVTINGVDNTHGGQLFLAGDGSTIFLGNGANNSNGTISNDTGGNIVLNTNGDGPNGDIILSASCGNCYLFNGNASLSFLNISAPHQFDFQNKDYTLAGVGDNISTFVNDSGYITTSTNNFRGLTNASITAVNQITWSASSVIGLTNPGWITAASSSLFTATNTFSGTVSTTFKNQIIYATSTGVLVGAQSAGIDYVKSLTITTTTLNYSQTLDTTTTVVTATSTNNTTLYSFTMPANTLGLGKTLRLEAMGTHMLAGPTNPTITMKLLYGGQTVFARATSAAIATSTLSGAWSELIIFSNASGTTNNQLLNSSFAATNGAGSALTSQMWNGSSTADSTASQALQLQVSMSQASASNTFSITNLTLMLDGATTTVITGITQN